MGRMPPKSSQGIKSQVERTPSPSVSTRRVTRNSPVKAPPKKQPVVTKKKAPASGPSKEPRKDAVSLTTESGISTRRTQRSPTKRRSPQPSSPIEKSLAKELRIPEEVEDAEYEDVDAHRPQETTPTKTKSTEIQFNQEIIPPKELTQDEEFQNEGRNIFALMKSEEVEEILERIDKQCSPFDNFNARKRELMVDWEKVSFSSYGPHQCQAVWAFLRHHARKVRILSEVVQEVKLKFSGNKAFQTKLIESLPGFPQKPPTALGGFHCFNRESWEQLKSEQPKDLPNYIKFQRLCKEKWNNLLQAERAKYEDKADLALAEYKRKVKEFYAKNPGLSERINRMQEETKRKRHLEIKSARAKRELTNPRTKIVRTKAVKSKPELNGIESLPNPYEDAPQMPQSPLILFIQSKLNRLDSPPTAEELPGLKNKYFDKWKSLSDGKRAKWVDVCLKECQRYMNEVEDYRHQHPEYLPARPLKLRSVCSKEDISIWSAANGFPISPKFSVWDLFCEEYLGSDENADLPEDERKKIALSKWQEMDWYHKEMYKMKYKISIVEYKKQIQTFFSTVPEFLKPLLYPQVPKKFLKLVNDIDKVNEGETTVLKFEEGGGNVTETEHEHAVGERGGGNRLESGDEGRQELEDDEPARKKRKKDKKKKKRKDLEALEKSESLQYEEDDYSHFENLNEMDYDQMEVEEPEELSHRPKKKKKKHRDTDDGEPETITGDIYSDSYSESQTDPVGSSKHKKSRKSSSFYGVTHDNEQSQQASPKNKSNFKAKREKLQENVSAHVEKMKSAWRKPVQVIPEEFAMTKPSSKNFNSENVIVQHDIFEAIRGIFDGRSHLGRRWSVYYYYARYVSDERVWIDTVNTEGLEKTALKIINTFLSLSAYQKDIFIEQSFSTHLRRTTFLQRDGRVSKGRMPAHDYFPGEPIRPPRLPKTYYIRDMLKRKKENPDFTFPRFYYADERTRAYYIKRLYHETRLYMKQYDKFISSLTPYELADYACLKARRFEEEGYRRQSINDAVKGFTFPLSNLAMELDDAGQESEPEMLRQRKPTASAGRMRSQRYRKSANPFAEDPINCKSRARSERKQRKLWRRPQCTRNVKPKVNASRTILKRKGRKLLTKKQKGRKCNVRGVKGRQRNIKQVKQVKDIDSDDPSDNEELGFRDISLYKGPVYKPLSHTLDITKLRRAAKYAYPMNDIIQKVNMENSQEDVATQTESSKVRVKGTQTSSSVKLASKGAHSSEHNFELKKRKFRAKATQTLSIMLESDKKKPIKTQCWSTSAIRKASAALKLTPIRSKKSETSTTEKLASTSKNTPDEPLHIELNSMKHVREKEVKHNKTTAIRKRFLTNNFCTIACDVVVPKKGRRIVRSALGKNVTSKLREENLAKCIETAHRYAEDESKQQVVIDVQLEDKSAESIVAVQEDQKVLNSTTSELVFPSSSEVVPGMHNSDYMQLPMSEYEFEMPEPLQPLAVTEESELVSEEKMFTPNSNDEMPQFTDLTVVNQIEEI